MGASPQGFKVAGVVVWKKPTCVVNDDCAPPFSTKTIWALAAKPATDTGAFHQGRCAVPSLTLRSAWVAPCRATEEEVLRAGHAVRPFHSAVEP
jgi:hypothetical protein